MNPTPASNPPAHPSRAGLQRIDLAGPYRLPPDQEARLCAAAAELGWKTCVYRPENAAERTAWLAGLGQALGLPAHFGANFDALYDCLTDPEAIAAPGALLVLGGLAPLGADVDILIAVLQAASDTWREAGRPFWALLDAPGLDLDPLPRLG